MPPLTEELRTQEAHDDALALASPADALLLGRREDTLREADKLVRDAFVKEYIIDFNAGNAMARIGVTNVKTAKTKGSIWLREPYVQKRIRQLTAEIDEKDIVTRNQIILGLLKEANLDSNHDSTRVAAWAHLAKMKGMLEHEKRERDGPAVVNNILMIPVADINSWATTAATMQSDLRARAVNRPVIEVAAT